MTEDTSSQHEPDGEQPGSFLASGLRIIHNSLYWLAGFIQLTEEEQIEAGIYLGHQLHG